MDALTQKVREGGRVLQVAVVIANGVNADGQRDILGVDLITTEDGPGWLAFLRSLGPVRGEAGELRRPRGARGDDRVGAGPRRLATLPHPFRGEPAREDPRNTRGRWSPACSSPVFEQPDRPAVHRQFREVCTALEGKSPTRWRCSRAAEIDVLVHRMPDRALEADPVEQPLERQNKEMRRCTDVVGILPDRTTVIRLVVAVLAEQHEEWACGRRYMSVESLAKARLTVIGGGDPPARGGDTTADRRAGSRTTSVGF
jgi:putative transposase